jgi:putative transposase
VAGSGIRAWEEGILAPKAIVAGGQRGREHPAIILSWRRHWPAVIPHVAFPADARRIVYTRNAIEALNAKLRPTVRTRGYFPSDEATLKLFYLVFNPAECEWRMPPKQCGMARAQLAILFDNRYQLA